MLLMILALLAFALLAPGVPIQAWLYMSGPTGTSSSPWGPTRRTRWCILCCRAACSGRPLAR